MTNGAKNKSKKNKIAPEFMGTVHVVAQQILAENKNTTQNACGMKMANKEEITNFSFQIEALAKEKRLSYIDAIVLYCESTGFEIELSAKLISNTLKAKIKMEAETLHYLPKSNTAKLPL